MYTTITVVNIKKLQYPHQGILIVASFPLTVADIIRIPIATAAATIINGDITNPFPTTRGRFVYFELFMYLACVFALLTTSQN